MFFFFNLSLKSVQNEAVRRTKECPLIDLRKRYLTIELQTLNTYLENDEISLDILMNEILTCHSFKCGSKHECV